MTKLIEQSSIERRFDNYSSTYKAEDHEMRQSAADVTSRQPASSRSPQALLLEGKLEQHSNPLTSNVSLEPGSIQVHLNQLTTKEYEE